MHLDIKLLGAMEVTSETKRVTELTAKKPRALLAYLAMHAGQVVPREKLAALLWSEHADEFARTNLRQCLSVLRRAIHHRDQALVNNVGGAALTADPSCFNLDVAVFDALCKQPVPSSYEKAKELYRGSFLDGFSINEPAFDEWQMIERRRLESQFSTFLGLLLSEANAAGDYHAVLRFGTHLLQIEPLDESVHRTVIHSMRRLGQHRAALKQYDHCRQVLHDELGVEPSAETSLIVEGVRSDGRIAELCVARSYSGEKISEVESKEIELAETETAAIAVTPKPSTQRLKLFTGLQLRWLLAACLAALLLTGLYSTVYQPGTLAQTLANRADDSVGVAVSPDDAIVRVTSVLPEKHKLIVMPLKNLSVNAETDYFSDGLTEDLITDLSRLSGLTVLSSNTSFAYRDSQLPIDVVAKELDVDYLLEGSVRRAGSDIRINLKLIETLSGAYTWTERVDYEMQNIFQVHDQILHDLVQSLALTLSDTDNTLLFDTTYVDPEAYDLLLRGLSPLREFSATGINIARQYFKEALAIQPDYARAHANLALSYGREVVFRLADFQSEVIQLGLSEADIAESLDNSIPQTEFARAVLYLASRQHAAAVEASRRAIALDENYADGYAVLAQTLAYGNLLAEALAAINKAQSLDPMHPFSYLWVEGHILYQMGRYSEALAPLEETIERNPTFMLGLMTLTANYGQLGRFDDADWINQEILTVNPGFSTREESSKAPYKFEKNRERYFEGLLKAGLPE